MKRWQIKGRFKNAVQGVESCESDWHEGTTIGRHMYEEAREKQGRPKSSPEEQVGKGVWGEIADIGQASRAG